jgi:hypothetical protein
VCNNPSPIPNARQEARSAGEVDKLRRAARTPSGNSISNEAGRQISRPRAYTLNIRARPPRVRLHSRLFRRPDFSCLPRASGRSFPG